MEPLTIAKHMEKIIMVLVKEGGRSEKLIEKKARAAEAYDKSIGIHTSALKASGNAVSMIKDLARKDAAPDLYAKIVAEDFLLVFKAPNSTTCGIRHFAAKFYQGVPSFDE